ncbi:MAG: Uma2 family endonuclease [Planctomycetota bacterium]|nr:Uma2 family endonuclease [Planctomycetota bacterium]
MIKRIMTAEEFAAQKYDLPEGGRWSELIAGEPVILDPPSDAHGNVVLNLSKALATWLEARAIGYACFELGIVAQRAPDTVLCPAVSYFVTGNRWDELDNVVTQTVPAVVIEVASSAARSRAMPARIESYRDGGVSVAIVIDPVEKKVAVHSHADQLKVLGQDDVFVGGADHWRFAGFNEPLLTGFEISVANLFLQPEWWEPRRCRD